MSEDGACEDHPEGRHTTVSRNCHPQSANSYATKGQGRIGTAAGVIEEITKPTPWCAPMVPVLKKSGAVRICVDLKRLNLTVERERYILPTLQDLTSRLAGATVFSSLDAASGFYQIPLHEDSQELTTFITPMGRYCYRRLPFGITSAPEIFMRKMN